MRRLGIILAGVLCAAAVGAGVYASAASRSADVVMLTGCLNPGSELNSVAVGASPRTPCGKDDTTVQLGNGDVTGVVAGTGLEGGADSGEATLQLSRP